MASQLFQVVEVNPNQTSGCGGCVCSEATEPDCQPPYVVFYNCDTDDPRRPQVVACARCIEAAHAKCVEAQETGDVLAGGERADERVEPEDPSDGSAYQVTGVADGESEIPAVPEDAPDEEPIGEPDEGSPGDE